MSKNGKTASRVLATLLVAGLLISTLSFVAAEVLDIAKEKDQPETPIYFDDLDFELEPDANSAFSDQELILDEESGFVTIRPVTP